MLNVVIFLRDGLLFFFLGYFGFANQTKYGTDALSFPILGIQDFPAA